MAVIGVTGHRILMEIGRINEGIDQAIDRIDQALGGPITLMSSLAEGADLMAARRAILRDRARLVAVLPLAEDDYIADFSSQESREEFLNLLHRADEVVRMPSVSTRDEAYERAGIYVLERSDALVAVWDGRGAQGQGGTGEIVVRARSLGLPLAWVHAGNRKPCTLEPTSLGDEQGRVTFENFY